MRPTTFFALFLAVFLLSGCATPATKPDPVTYEWHGVALCGNLLIFEAIGSDGNVVEWVGQEAWHAAIAAAEKYPESEVNVWNLEAIYPQLSALCGVSA